VVTVDVIIITELHGPSTELLATFKRARKPHTNLASSSQDNCVKVGEESSGEGTSGEGGRKGIDVCCSIEKKYTSS
jgi:hypothetical protein